MHKKKREKKQCFFFVFVNKIFLFASFSFPWDLSEKKFKKLELFTVCNESFLANSARFVKREQQFQANAKTWRFFPSAKLFPLKIFDIKVTSISLDLFWFTYFTVDLGTHSFYMKYFTAFLTWYLMFLYQIINELHCKTFLKLRSGVL